MSASIFPALNGTVLIRRSPEFKNTIHTAASGKEDRTEWALVRYRWDLSNGVLRENKTAPAPWAAYSEPGVVNYFYETVGRGTNESFHIVDPYDGTTDRVVRFAEDSFSMERVVSGVWACTFSLISVL
jgi:hypothetical protein